MGQGSFWVWAVVWLPWAVLVSLEIAREHRDLRWTVSAVALALLAALTWGRFRRWEGRFVILGEIAVVVLVFSTWGIAQARRRARRMAKWARSGGYDATAVARRRSEVTLPEPLLRLPLLARSAWPRTRGVAARRDDQGQHWMVFDVFTPRRRAGLFAGGGPRGVTVVAMRRPGGLLPRFQLRPRGLPAVQDGGPTGDEVAIPLPPEFASRFRVGGDEVRNLAALFDPGLASEFACHPGWLVEGEGEWLAAAYYDESRGMKPSGLRLAPLDRLDGLVADASALLAMVARRADRRAFRDSGAA